MRTTIRRATRLRCCVTHLSSAGTRVVISDDNDHYTGKIGRIVEYRCAAPTRVQGSRVKSNFLVVGRGKGIYAIVTEDGHKVCYSPLQFHRSDSSLSSSRSLFCLNLCYFMQVRGSERTKEGNWQPRHAGLADCHHGERPCSQGAPPSSSPPSPLPLFLSFSSLSLLRSRALIPTSFLLHTASARLP